MEREKLKSRLGFILLSAGCAIGIGNVWKFPYMAGHNKSAYIDADFYSDNFTSRYDSVSKPGEASRGKDTRKKVHYYNGSLKGIFKLGQAQKFSVGMEYVKETLMSATDDLDGENIRMTNLMAKPFISAEH